VAVIILGPGPGPVTGGSSGGFAGNSLDAFGVIYDSADDQIELVQAAFDATTDALWVGGRVRHLSARIINTHNCAILGPGSADELNTSPAGFGFSESLSGNPGPLIEHDPHGAPIRMEGFTIEGPGAGAPATPGDFPAAGPATNFPTRARLQDMCIYGCRSAVDARSDHLRFTDFNFRGNGYGIDFGDNADGGLGDITITNGYLDAQSVSSIGISDSATIANARFAGNGHLGFSPFCFHRYVGSQTARNTAMVGVVFENWSFEAPGNALIYDEAGGGSWVDLTFESNGFTAIGGPKIIADFPSDRAALFSLGNEGWATNWSFRQFPLIDGPPTILAKYIRGIKADVCDVDMFDPTTGFTNPYRPLTWFGGGVVDAITFGDGGRGAGGSMAHAHLASEDLNRGDLLQRDFVGQVKTSLNGPDSVIVGVSCDDYEAGEIAFYCPRFETSAMIVNNYTGANIAQGKGLEPDPDHPGGVRAATARERVIGWAYASLIPAGGSGPAQIMI
jgi:hypothetical protein